MNNQLKNWLKRCQQFISNHTKTELELYQERKKAMLASESAHWKELKLKSWQRLEIYQWLDEIYAKKNQHEYLPFAMKRAWLQNQYYIMKSKG